MQFALPRFRTADCVSIRGTSNHCTAETIELRTKMNFTGRESAPTAPSFLALRLVVILAAALGVAVGGWWLIARDNGSSHAAKPVAASVGDLRALPSSVGHVVYWAGPKASVTYELTRASRGYVYVRYLPQGVEIGDKRPQFLTVGTYPQPDAFASVQKAAKKKDEIVRNIGNGGLAVASPQRPQSIYFAYPGSDLLVEVYNPSSDQAFRAVVSGQVKPIQ
jgi:hypothetical protein